jgi:hypothetical protein
MNVTDILSLIAIVNNMSLADVFVAKDAADEQGDWQPANGGSEEPFVTRNKRRLLYCWQPSTGRHAYMDLDKDLILSDEEAQLALGY